MTTPKQDLTERMLNAYLDDSLAPGYDMRRAARVMLEAMREWNGLALDSDGYPTLEWRKRVDAFAKESNLE